MKAMVSIHLFEGGDPSKGEHRTMTIGTHDPADLPRTVAAWAHDVVRRMQQGETPVEEDDEGDEPPARAVHISDVPMALWEDLTDAAA